MTPQQLLAPMFPALPASAIAGALADAGGDMRLAVEGLLAAAQVTLERGASGYLRSGLGYWESSGYLRSGLGYWESTGYLRSGLGYWKGTWYLRSGLGYWEGTVQGTETGTGAHGWEGHSPMLLLTLRTVLGSTLIVPLGALSRTGRQISHGLSAVLASTRRYRSTALSVTQAQYSPVPLRA